MTREEQFQQILSQHKIEKIAYYNFRARYPRLHGKNARLSYHGFGGSVNAAKIYTDQGAMGWAQIAGSPEAAKAVGEKLMGRQLTEVFAPETGILSPDWAPFDIALHDLAGVILGMPVSRMIRETAASSIKVYDGAIYMNDIIPEDNAHVR